MILIFLGDMDALPLVEDSGVSFPSKFHGKHHACGHVCKIIIKI